MISVVVPTRNRRELLADVVGSIFRQGPMAGPFEVLLVDTASTDGTPETAAELRRVFPALRSLRAEEPGLHTGRHLGEREARGEILVYVDDDVIVCPGWLEAIRAAFADPGVALAGGRVLPEWEAAPPWWVEVFRTPLPGGWTIGPLSLIDLGDTARDIPHDLVYGCNLAVRREVLRRCGGFHPDSLPRAMIERRGDGETGLVLAIGRAGLRARYVPEACVRHRIGAERLTEDYFRWRAYCQGISNSYTEIRRRHGLEPPVPEPPRRGWRIPALGGLRRALADWRRFGPAGGLRARALRVAVELSCREGVAFHEARVVRDPDLLAWVLRPDYWDWRLPGGGAR